MKLQTQYLYLVFNRVQLLKAEADAVIKAAMDVIGYDAGSYNKAREEEDEKTFLRLDANLSDNHNLTFHTTLLEGLLSQLTSIELGAYHYRVIGTE